ncbi:MAG: tRNA (adenosine(37)-N6)-threonylcarbamoyltransferase complex dimerization subunit type 1 TsaB [Candidatus Levybacteria bacterium]|nr:tRNA (adenosine(37)-N6)-threonylcarbamoyltransferase complex dimerization subunit type 1 TsaB [Candidatus Levybacteria bacterium]
MNKLVIDTTDAKKTTIKLVSDKLLDKITEENTKKSQITLILIDKILKKNKINPADLDEIEVNTGPGSFTGTRVGVAIANALGFGLDIKVNGKKSKQALPRYS